MDLSNTVKAIIILGADGKRALARYFDPQLDQGRLEKQIFLKTKSRLARDDILVIDNCIIFHKYVTDLHLYIVGHENENPLILNKLLSCLVQVISEILTKHGDSFSEHLDQIILALDEICDQGIILEIDPSAVMERISLKEGVTEPSYVNLLQSATEQFRLSLMRQ